MHPLESNGTGTISCHSIPETRTNKFLLKHTITNKNSMKSKRPHGVFFNVGCVCLFINVTHYLQSISISTFYINSKPNVCVKRILILTFIPIDEQRKTATRQYRKIGISIKRAISALRINLSPYFVVHHKYIDYGQSFSFNNYNKKTTHKNCGTKIWCMVKRADGNNSG